VVREGAVVVVAAGALDVVPDAVVDVVPVGAVTEVDVGEAGFTAGRTALVVDGRTGGGAVVVGRGARVTGTVGAGTAGT
jgi:hypothetical protein